MFIDFEMILRLKRSFWYVDIDMVKAFDVYENHTSLREIWFFFRGKGGNVGIEIELFLFHIKTVEILFFRFANDKCWSMIRNIL